MPPVGGGTAWAWRWTPTHRPAPTACTPRWGGPPTTGRSPGTGTSPSERRPSRRDRRARRPARGTRHPGRRSAGVDVDDEPRRVRQRRDPEGPPLAADADERLAVA